MIRISKLADYALKIVAHMSNKAAYYTQANDIAIETHVSRPTTAKVLKILAKSGLLESARGSSGGYRLRRAPEDISVAEIIQLIEGPMAIMDCSLSTAHCALYNKCEIHAPWTKINQVIVTALETIKIRDLLPGETRGQTI